MPAQPATRAVLMTHAPPSAFAPMTRAILARLGYAILDPEEFARTVGEDERPACLVVDERSLTEVADDGGPPIPIVALTGRQGVAGIDPRIVGAIRRPAGLHELYRLLQHVLEVNPRSTPRIPTHLSAHCLATGRSWSAKVLSLSENGCLLRSPEPLLLDSSLELRFKVPRAGEVRLEAEVAYQLVPDVGLVFSAAPASVRRTIFEYVAEALAAA